ncbi:MAG: MFS transporter [Coprothermobacterota bacterium]|nr:MFS transporter [Coprothermobacterota bacterium]
MARRRENREMNDDGSSGALNPEPRRQAVGVLSALGYRDYRHFWTGALVSDIGTLIQTTALMWFVKTNTASNAWVGAVSLASVIPVLLFVELAGYLADKVDLKRLLLGTQFFMMATALILAIGASLGWTSMGFFLTIVILQNIAFTFGFPAWELLLPDLVPKDHMLNALALGSAEWNLGKVVGPALGALILTTWSAAGAFYVNAASFLFVIGVIMATTVKTSTMPIPPARKVYQSLVKRGRYVLHTRWMVYLLATLGIASFFGFSYTVLFPAFAQEVLGGGAGAYSFLLVFTGLGAILGAPLVTVLKRKFKGRDIIKGSLLCFGAILLCFSFSGTYWLSAVLAAGMGCALLIFGSIVNTVLQVRVEEEMRGSIVSYYIMMSITFSGFGALFLGSLADTFQSPRIPLQLGSLVCLVLAAVVILIPSILKEAVTSQG